MALRYDRLYLVREEGDRLIGELVQDVAPYHSFLLDPKDTGKPTEQGKERPMNLRIYGSQTNELYLGLVPGTPNPGDVHLAVVDPATGAAVTPLYGKGRRQARWRALQLYRAWTAGSSR